MSALYNYEQESDEHLENEEDQAPLWLITFTDIMALMLTFFVLLYSMSVPKFDKYSQLSQAVEEGLINYPTLSLAAGKSPEQSVESIKTFKGLDFDYMIGLLRNYVQKHNLGQSVMILKAEDRILISLPAEIAFSSGQADLSIEAKKALASMNGILNKFPNRIRIVGHADPTPIGSQNQYQNNWALSLARAQSVAEFLKQRGYKKELSAHGVSSGHFKEIPTTISSENKNRLSRRVDIVLMGDKGLNN